ncbi:glycosyltransferase involved in cell wall biosynthesis [Mucilaginibacter sp. UYP25]|uniref:glycosyltransferase family 2 protein n=1 Tax=unclassified Mucilaginibacter TaxID=2617802 RepID=UPI003397BA11
MIQGGSKHLNGTSSYNPVVSIVIATYNAAKVLEGAIKSITAHAPQNTELIIIDGNSTDGTIDLLQQYDEHITLWQSEPDNGIYYALNKGAGLFKGKWVYFMGADDRLLPGFGKMTSLLRKPDTLYYGDVETDGPLFLGEFTEYRLAKFCINHQTIFYPAKVFKKYSYNTRYKVLADYELNIACWGNKNFKKQYWPIQVAFYSTKGYSSVATDDLFQEDKLSLIKENMSWFTYLRFLLKRLKEKRKPDGVFRAVNP